MEFKEMIKKIAEIAAKNASESNIIGIRFEDKERNIGDIITDCSKSNPNREDEREFPEYGTPDYNALPDLDGVCAYQAWDYWTDHVLTSGYKISAGEEITYAYCCEHAYLLVAPAASCKSGEDNGEIIMDRPEVLAILF